MARGLLECNGSKESVSSGQCANERRDYLVHSSLPFFHGTLQYWRSILQEEYRCNVALAERPSTPTRHDLSTLARQHLDRHPHFRGRLGGVRIEHEDRNLFLSGQLPTFYLKQLVQEAVRHVPGVQFVYNQIDVVSPHGVSSVRY